MFTQIVESLQFSLNNYLKQTFGFEEDITIFSNLINIDGSIPSQIANKVILTYINLEEEAMSRLGYQPIGRENQFQSGVTNFNLNILISSNRINYQEGLKLISSTFEYFSNNPIVNTINFPGLDPSIERITVDLIPTNSEERHLIWKSMGVNYLPSLLYKIRVLRVKL